MLLNFQKRFAPSVLSGEKRQTIRSAISASGKHKPKPVAGSLAHCYTGLRTRSSRLLGVWPIKRVEVIRMEIGREFVDNVIVGADRLDGGALDRIARADGFASRFEMSQWFASTYAQCDFYGWIIEWEWEAPQC